MIEEKSEKCEELVSLFEELKESEKLDVMSILFEHIDNELINDGNYATGDEALENDKEVLTSIDIGFNTTKPLAIQLFNYKRKMYNMEMLEIKDVETNIKITDSINQILKQFYKLPFCDKLDFLIESMYLLSMIKEVNNNLDTNEIIGNILDFKKRIKE